MRKKCIEIRHLCFVTKFLNNTHKKKNCELLQERQMEILNFYLNYEFKSLTS